jgi:hypothetical protein
MFFGSGNRVAEKETEERDLQKEARSKTRKRTEDTPREHQEGGEETLSAVSKLSAHVAQQIDQHHIPRDVDQLRDSVVYKGPLHMLQWQRDSYLVGDEYADWRKEDRKRKQQQQKQHPYYSLLPAVWTEAEEYEIPYDKTALGHAHLEKIASDLIRTDTVCSAAKPVVCRLPGGVLFEPAVKASVRLIEGQQDNLNWTVQQNALRFLDNPSNREALKRAAKSYLQETAKKNEQPGTNSDETSATSGNNGQT